MQIDHESLVGTFEQKRELVRKFNLIDDDFFTIVMQDPGAFEVMLRILTGRDDLHVKDVRTQYAIRNLVGHSVVLDGYAEDDEHRAYNVEVQVRDSDCHPKRVRYYQSNIDLTLLEKGTKYEDLPDLYLIFITTFDLFRKGKNHYEIDRILRGYSEEVSNGVHEMYFNTAVKDDTRISELLQFFKNSVSDSVSFGRLSDRVKFYKETEKGVNHMCDAVRDYGDRREDTGRRQGEEIGRRQGEEIGRRQGEAKKLTQIISALMQNTKCTLEEALHMTGYTMDEYQENVAILAKSE